MNNTNLPSNEAIAKMKSNAQKFTKPERKTLHAAMRFNPALFSQENTLSARAASSELKAEVNYSNPSIGYRLLVQTINDIFGRKPDAVIERATAKFNEIMNYGTIQDILALDREEPQLLQIIFEGLRINEKNNGLKVDPEPFVRKLFEKGYVLTNPNVLGMYIKHIYERVSHISLRDPYPVYPSATLVRFLLEQGANPKERITMHTVSFYEDELIKIVYTIAARGNDDEYAAYGRLYDILKPQSGGRKTRKGRKGRKTRKGGKTRSKKAKRSTRRR